MICGKVLCELDVICEKVLGEKVLRVCDKLCELDVICEKVLCELDVICEKVL